MTRTGRLATAVWAAFLLAAIVIVAFARYTTDLSAFLPRSPTPTQRLLVDQLREGIASRLILVGIEGADPAERARISMAMARQLRGDAKFMAVSNGEAVGVDKDREVLFNHRYLLSETVTPERFTAEGLRDSIQETLDLLASPVGMLAKSLLPRDPTGEMLQIIDQLGSERQPPSSDGVWASRDGKRALLVAQTRAAGSDTDGQEAAVAAVRAAFDVATRATCTGARNEATANVCGEVGAGGAATEASSATAGAGGVATEASSATAGARGAATEASSAAAGAGSAATETSSTAAGARGAATETSSAAAGARGAATEASGTAAGASGTAAGASGARAALSLEMSGPGVFSVAARANIKQQVATLSVVSTLLITLMLLWVYRSGRALVLGLIPVASGALAGISAVALGFGSVHGITLGFGVTLIGESVDYSIYLFIQSQQRNATLWSTIRLGVLTSVVGFMSLLPSGFPGLQQLGLFSISGLIVAALVTRYVLPHLMPPNLTIADVTPLGAAVAAGIQRVRMPTTLLLVVPIAAALVLYTHRGSVWNHEISALSPVSASDQALDAMLRSDIGAPDVSYLVVVSGPSQEAVLHAAEAVNPALNTLVEEKVISGFETPARYLPSLEAQRARQTSIPKPEDLQGNLVRALQGLPLQIGRLEPFLHDIDSARTQPLLTRKDLDGTSLATGVDALLLSDGARWSALLPLRVPTTVAIDIARVHSAVSKVALGSGVETVVLDVKGEIDKLYSSYLTEVVRLSLAGFAGIVVLLGFFLRSAGRTARVVAPLALAVLTVTAGLVLLGQQLTILHLIGMLLIVAVGSNYALFFDRSSHEGSATLTLASLVVANTATVLGFGVLAFSSVPVLSALGSTVAPGAFLALVFSALLAGGGDTPRAMAA
jgi:predicted exporter